MTSQDYTAFWVAGLWQGAFDAKTRSLDGDPEQILTGTKRAPACIARD